MLSRANSMVWMEGSSKGGDEETCSWPENNNKNSTELLNNKEEIEIGALSTYKTMLELADDQNEEWYSGSSSHQGAAAATTMHDISFSPPKAAAADDNNNNNNNNQLLLQSAADSSASCNSPTSASVFNNLDTLSQVNYFQRSLINPVVPNNHPLEIGSFDQMGCHETSGGGGGYLESAFMINRPPPPLPQIGTLLNFSSSMFPTNTSSTSVGFGGTFDFGDGTSMTAAAVGNSFFNNNNSRSNKILKPLDNFASIGSQPTLFQKRAALKKNNLAAATNSNVISLLKSPTINMGSAYDDDHKKGAEMKIRKTSSSGGDDDDDDDVDVLDDFSIDGSNLNYDSDDQFLDNNTAAAVNNNNNNKVEVEFESRKNGNGGGSGDHKKGGGKKKKGLPAKNLMAERRRRKKLNDRLYMLRSVVPKISKV